MSYLNSSYISINFIIRKPHGMTNIEFACYPFVWNPLDIKYVVYQTRLDAEDKMIYYGYLCLK